MAHARAAGADGRVRPEPLSAAGALSPPACRRVPGHEPGAVGARLAPGAGLGRRPRHGAGRPAAAVHLHRGRRKQSIYGFRDADVAVLARAVVSIAGLRPDGSVRRAIRKSFRAVPALLAFTERSVRCRAEAGPARRVRVRRVGSLSRGRTRGCGPNPAWVGGSRRMPTVCAERVASEIDTLLASGQVRDKASGLARAVRPGRHRDPVPVPRGTPGVRVGARGARHRIVRLQRPRVLRGRRDQGRVRAAAIPRGPAFQPACRGLPAIAVRAALRRRPPAARAGACRRAS